MKLKKHFILFLLPLIYSGSLKAQDPVFSQNLATRAYLNPAIVGTDSTLVLSTGYHLQWYDKSPGGGTYSTTRFSADQYVRGLRGGIGLDVMHDIAGGLVNTTNVTFSYAPHFELFSHKLSIQPGFSLGYFQRTLDWNQLTLGNQIDTNGFVYSSVPHPTLYQQKSGVNFNAGVFIYTNKIYGGVAVMHINQPDEGFIGHSRLPYALTLNAGINFSFKNDVNRKLIISPNIISKHQQNFNETLLGITTKYKWFLLGVSYRIGDSAILNAGFQNRFLKVGYSYDYTTSTLTNATGGTHEIQLTWFLHYQKKPCKINTIRFI